MALPASGAIGIGNVQTEFGGTNPAGMSEYYSGGAYVPAGTTGGNGSDGVSAGTVIPTSGALKLANFYNATATVASFTITSAVGSRTYTAPYVSGRSFNYYDSVMQTASGDAYITVSATITMDVTLYGAGGYTGYGTTMQPGTSGRGMSARVTFSPGTSYLLTIGGIAGENGASTIGDQVTAGVGGGYTGLFLDPDNTHAKTQARALIIAGGGGGSNGGSTARGATVTPTSVGTNGNGTVYSSTPITSGAAGRTATASAGGTGGSGSVNGGTGSALQGGSGGNSTLDGGGGGGGYWGGGGGGGVTSGTPGGGAYGAGFVATGFAYVTSPAVVTRATTSSFSNMNDGSPFSGRAGSCGNNNTTNPNVANGFGASVGFGAVPGRKIQPGQANTNVATMTARIIQGYAAGATNTSYQIVWRADSVTTVAVPSGNSTLTAGMMSIGDPRRFASTVSGSQTFAWYDTSGNLIATCGNSTSAATSTTLPVVGVTAPVPVGSYFVVYPSNSTSGTGLSAMRHPGGLTNTGFIRIGNSSPNEWVYYFLNTSTEFTGGSSLPIIYTPTNKETPLYAIPTWSEVQNMGSQTYTTILNSYTTMALSSGGSGSGAARFTFV